MAVYTVRFAVYTITAGGNAVVYTAPANVTSVIRSIVASNGDAAAAQIYVQINTSGGSLEAYVYRNPTHPAATAIEVDMRQVMEPGEQLEVGTTGTDATFTITGYQLT